jgi:hypothetical protein
LKSREVVEGYPLSLKLQRAKKNAAFRKRLPHLIREPVLIICLFMLVLSGVEGSCFDGSKMQTFQARQKRLRLKCVKEVLKCIYGIMKRFGVFLKT